MFKVNVTSTKEVSHTESDTVSLYVPDSMTEQDVINTIKDICITYVERNWDSTCNLRDRGEFTIADFNALIPESLCEEFSVYRADKIEESVFQIDVEQKLVDLNSEIR